MVVDLVMLLTVAAFIGYLIVHTPKTSFDPDRKTYPVKGIDVSSHNGDIDFLQAAADTVSFVMIKATEGTDFCDAKFETNYTNAQKAGLKVGAYHFFRFDTPGDVQAWHFLGTVNGRTFDLPLAIDVEKWGNTQTYDEAQVKANLAKMVSIIEATGYPMMIYTNKHGHGDFIKDCFDRHYLWICSLSSLPTRHPWVLWQHTHSGKVRGIQSVVDVNTYNGTLEAFSQWTQPFTVDIPDNGL